MAKQKKINYTKVLRNYEKNVKAIIYNYKIFQKSKLSLGQIEHALRFDNENKIINGNVTKQQFDMWPLKEQRRVLKVAMYVNTLANNIQRYKNLQIQKAQHKEALEKRKIDRQATKEAKQYLRQEEKEAAKKLKKEIKDEAKERNFGTKSAQASWEAMEAAVEKDFQKTVNKIKQKLKRQQRYQQKKLDAEAQEKIYQFTDQLDKWDRDTFNEQVEDLLKSEESIPEAAKITGLPNNPDQQYTYIQSIIKTIWDQAYDEVMELYYNGLVQKEDIWFETEERKRNKLKAYKKRREIAKQDTWDQEYDDYFNTNTNWNKTM